MPVIPQLGEAIKIGKSYSGGLQAEPSALIDTMTQSQLSSSALMPVPFIPGVIPVIPIGISLSIIMIKIEALMFKSFEDLSNISKKILQKYQTDLEKAKAQRKIAANKLYNDLINKQNEIKEELNNLQNELDEINKKIPELEEYQNSEMQKYMNVIFNIKDRAKKEDELGHYEQRDNILNEIQQYDSWLAEIIKITVEIITLKLRIPSLKNEIEEKKYLSELNIPQNWESDIILADLFEVPIPAYMDLPNQPILPTTPPIPKENEFIKASKKAFAMWLTTPMILPMGIPLASILLYIQALAPVPPKVAAKLESTAQASILQGSGCV